MPLLNLIIKVSTISSHYAIKELNNNYNNYDNNIHQKTKKKPTTKRGKLTKTVFQIDTCVSRSKLESNSEIDLEKYSEISISVNLQNNRSVLVT